jgi:hypothetical protein
MCTMVRAVSVYLSISFHAGFRSAERGIWNQKSDVRLVFLDVIEKKGVLVL